VIFAPDFYFVGAGSLESRLQSEARSLGVTDRVHFSPPQPPQALPALYRSAWAVVLPSNVEGLNTTQLEAALQGTPCVAADAPGLRDFVKPGLTGWLFTPGNAKELARTLAEVFSHPDERQRRGLSARKAASAFRIEAHADRLLLALLEEGIHLLPLKPSESSEEGAR
jgi:glycosyltransferase involved in cell wall biosynthesis